MKKQRRVLAWLLTAAVLLCALPMPVSANSPAVAPWFTFRLANLPEDVAYAELLVPLPESHEKYTPLVEENLPSHWQPDTAIVTYREGDYCAYTFHYQNASSFIWTKRNHTVTFFAGAGSDPAGQTIRYDHADEIAALGDVKLALLDENGEILQISSAISLQPRKFMSYLSNDFSYDAATDTVVVETYTNGIGIFLYVHLALFGMVLTCLTEGLVGRAFGLKKYKKLIRRTNIVSQLLMHLGYVLCYSLIFWRYQYATILLEILVYAGEYLFYRRWMTDVSPKRCVTFALTANTVSLGLGLCLLAL